jgi:hypothetical protein
MTSGSVDCAISVQQLDDIDTHYAASNLIERTIAADLASQSVSFVSASIPVTSVAYQNTFDVSYVVPAAGTNPEFTASGGCIEVPSSTSISGTTLTTRVRMVSGTTQCSLALLRAASANFSSASDSATVNARKLAQTISAIGIPTSLENGSQYTIAFSATRQTPLPELTLSGGCQSAGVVTVAGDHLTKAIEMTSGSLSCVIEATQDGDENYAPAAYLIATSNPLATISATKIHQNLVANAPESAAFGDFVDIGLAAGESSRVPVASVVAGSGCRADGDVYVMTSGTSNCVIRVTQQGDDLFADAEITITILATKRLQDPVGLVTTLKRSKSFLMSAFSTPDSRPLIVSASGKCTAAKVKQSGVVRYWKIKAKSSRGTCVLNVQSTATANLAAIVQTSRIAIK